jgi:hypothetical protein
LQQLSRKQIFFAKILAKINIVAFFVMKCKGNLTIVNFRTISLRICAKMRNDFRGNAEKNENIRFNSTHSPNRLCLNNVKLVLAAVVSVAAELLLQALDNIK